MSRSSHSAKSVENIYHFLSYGHISKIIQYFIYYKTAEEGGRFPSVFLENQSLKLDLVFLAFFVATLGDLADKATHGFESPRNLICTYALIVPKSLSSM